MNIPLWDWQGELQKDRHSPELLHVFIRNTDPSEVDSSTEYAAGSGAARTGMCNIDEQF